VNVEKEKKKKKFRDGLRMITFFWFHVGDRVLFGLLGVFSGSVSLQFVE